jgi:hypothetical protein
MTESPTPKPPRKRPPAKSKLPPQESALPSPAPLPESVPQAFQRAARELASDSPASLPHDLPTSDGPVYQNPFSPEARAARVTHIPPMALLDSGVLPRVETPIPLYLPQPSGSPLRFRWLRSPDSKFGFLWQLLLALALGLGITALLRPERLLSLLGKIWS